MECKKTKQQWQATVISIADCGPAGVPEEAVIQFLKVRYRSCAPLYILNEYHTHVLDRERSSFESLLKMA